MATHYAAFPGMEDILPGDSEKWQWLEEKTRSFFASRAFREIRTPILEPTELFTRSIGETTDIVHKEMYTFKDRGERSMTMRPEMTASVARAVIQHGLLKTNKDLSLYYTGPMFRAERPQAGRKRQFHQIGAELINVTREGEPYRADWVIIKALADFLDYLKVKNVKFRLNDLTLINGDQGDSIRAKLRDYFEGHKAKLDPDSVFRLDKNVLRIFDSKIPETRAVIKDVPWDTIAPFSAAFSDFVSRLKALPGNITFEVDRTLVRGLDYYTGVVFEAASSSLGAQDALAGGGRYDRLYEELGSNTTPCTGFSIGMERLLMVLGKNEPSIEQQLGAKKIYFVPLMTQVMEFDAVRDTALRLQEWGFNTLLPAETGNLSMGEHLKRASKLGASFAVIRGDDEVKKGGWTLKNLTTRDQFFAGSENELLSMLMLKTEELKLS
ncbi:MAG: histidine--tRNA ligase [Candidatus Omnitrophica bacterium]|nr:histidine--tRNA ligase [Candidatus Omnitrophota bacterium]